MYINTTNKRVGKSAHYDIKILKNPAIVKFNTFDFERPLSLYYDDNGKPKYEYI